MKIFLALVCYATITASVFSQSKINSVGYSESNDINFSQGSEFRVRRTVDIENDSKNEDVIIEINKNTVDFNLKIESRISQGEMTIEIYDSSGKKQGNFTVETQLSSGKKEDVSGQYRKAWKNVPSGKWRVKIIPSNATAKVMITSSFLNE